MSSERKSLSMLVAREKTADEWWELFPGLSPEFIKGVVESYAGVPIRDHVNVLIERRLKGLLESDTLPE